MITDRRYNDSRLCEEPSKYYFLLAVLERDSDPKHQFLNLNTRDQAVLEVHL